MADDADNPQQPMGCGSDVAVLSMLEDIRARLWRVESECRELKDRIRDLERAK